MKQILKTICCVALAMTVALGVAAQYAASKGGSSTNAGANKKDEVRDRLHRILWFQQKMGTKFFQGELPQEEVDSIYDFFREQHQLASAQIPFRGFALHETCALYHGPGLSKKMSITTGFGRPLTMLSDDGQCIIYCELSPATSIQSNANIAEVIEGRLNEDIKLNVLNLAYYEPGVTTKMVAQWKKDYLREYSGQSWLKASGATNVYVWTIPKVDNIYWRNSEGFKDDVMPECKHFCSLAICKPGSPILSIWLAMTEKGKLHLNKYIKDIARSVEFQ